MTLPEQLKHLNHRAAFGPHLSMATTTVTLSGYVQSLFPPAETRALEVVTFDEFLDYSASTSDRSTLPMAERRQRSTAFRERINDLNVAWMDEMVHGACPLREKMALFWTNHLPIRGVGPYYTQQYLHVIRTHALGSFATLLREVAKTPAMLRFLNNQQNKKLHPNENFAREVMELFTVGRGHYTEADIKEAARAFTGWTYTDEKGFLFRGSQHDEGEKKILGKTGKFTGDDVLDILLAQKQTAIHLCEKIYAYFVREDQRDPGRIQTLARHYYESNYDTGALLREMFTAEWFYDAKNLGARIKSPVDFVTGLRYVLPMAFPDPKTLISLQRTLGQYIFYPPNVAGWPGGTAWIDGSCLVLRMRLPEALLGDQTLNLRPKEIDAEMNEPNKMAIMQDNKGRKTFEAGNARPDWTAWVAYWGRQDNSRLPELMAQFLLPVAISPARLQELNRFTDKDSPEKWIRSLTIRLMMLPEYQLC